MISPGIGSQGSQQNAVSPAVGAGQAGQPGQNPSFDLQSAVSQGRVEDVAGHLQANPQDRDQVYNSLLKSDMGMIYHLEQLATPGAASDGGIDIGGAVDGAVAGGVIGSALGGPVGGVLGAGIGGALGAKLKADEYKSDKGYKELNKTQQAAVDKEVATVKESASYKKASAADQARMREAIADAAVLKANPKGVEAQNEVGKTLNDEKTAALLKDNKAFADQFLKAAGGQLDKAVDAYLKLRPKGDVNDALKLIGDTQFAKTAEGQKVLLKSLVLERAGNIEIKDAGGGTRGLWSPSTDKLTVDDQFAGSAAGVAVEIVHEATHAVDDDDYAGKVYSIDEEFRTNTNQVAAYRELNKSEGFTDAELDRRANNPIGGSLRSDIQSRYPTLPEHRYPSK
jgi:hypothetical protein